jgi:UDP-N-acetylglucosamine acyltransferase
MGGIHPTAVIHEGARLHPSVEVGPYAVIGPKVTVGEGTRVGPHVVIDGRTTLGRDNHLYPFSSVGGDPQDLKFQGEDSELVIGDANLVREFVTLNKGTTGGGGVTRIGSHNLFMANSHVGHDCQVGSHCVLANSVALGGHVEIGDHAILGGLAGVHQFTRVGAHAFIAGGALVVMDVPPYCIAQGDRAELVGINKVGLERRGFSKEQLGRIEDAYRLLFRAKLGLAEALARVRAELGGNAEVDALVEFISSSKRGITR